MLACNIICPALTAQHLVIDCIHMKIVICTPEFNLEDMKLIENIIRANNIFVLPSNLPDIYDLRNYITAGQIQEKKLKALVDNNLLTRAIALARGKEVPNESEQSKGYILAAATMAYLMAADFLIEPSISIYEKASKSSHDSAVEELYYFRVADNIHITEWINIALKRKRQIATDELEIAKQHASKINRGHENNYAKILNPWKVNYYFILKAAQLWKSNDDDVEAAEDFISWMAEDSFFNAVSTVFTLIFFSPNRFSKMIKGINSISSQSLHDGLKNAAWDLAYITQWGKYCLNADQDCLWLLCSNDHALREIATWYLADGSLQDPLYSLLEQFWGNKKAKRIINTYNNIVSKVDRDKRKRNLALSDRFRSVDISICELEHVLLLQS
jgi:hypothetical protein